MPAQDSDRRLRVVHVVDSLSGSGGAENRLVEEVIALRDRFDQRVVRLFEADFLQNRLEEAGIPVEALGFRGRHAARRLPLIARRLRARLRAWPPDVVHTTLVNGNLAGQLAARPLGIPVVSEFNRDAPTDRTWKARVMQAVARWVSATGDVHYRAVSESARATNSAPYRLPPERATVIPRAVAVDRSLLDPSRERFGLAAAGPLFVTVARLAPEKGHDRVVAAFARVRRSLPDAELAIAGAPGSATATVERAIDELRLKGSVHLLGFRDDARDLVAAADVFAFGSSWEGMPGAVLEAMAIGTPVVAVDIPPVSEATDGGRLARLVPLDAVDAFAEAMIAAYRSPERATELAAAQQWAARFDLAAVARRLGDLFEARVTAASAAPSGPDGAPASEPPASSPAPGP